jgi:hypothetical protein
VTPVRILSQGPSLAAWTDMSIVVVLACVLLIVGMAALIVVGLLSD